jgi:hypothetical protein
LITTPKLPTQIICLIGHCQKKRETGHRLFAKTKKETLGDALIAMAKLRFSTQAT